MSHRAGVVSRYRSRVKRGKGGRKILNYLEVLLRDPCVYCQEFGCDSIDHIVPVIREDELTTGSSRDHWSNLAPCHISCNVKKGSHGVLGFLQFNFHNGPQGDSGPAET